jgi:hypothetical protein
MSCALRGSLNKKCMAVRYITKAIAMEMSAEMFLESMFLVLKHLKGRKSEGFPEKQDEK